MEPRPLSQLERIARHPNCTDVEKALTKLRKAGWLGRRGGHWWVVFCPNACECFLAVPGSPSSCENAARRIVRKLSKCKGAEGN